MNKTIHSAHSKIFCEQIRSLRKAAGMSQRDLAAALGREYGMVARIELGERRVDMMEAFQLYKALGVDPDKAASDLMQQFRRVSHQ